MDRRKSAIKKGVNQDESRRRREASAVAIRKEKKEENMMKRRNLSAAPESSSIECDSCPTSSSSAETKTTNGPTDFNALRNGLLSNEMHIQLASIKGFRKALSVEQNPPIQECIDCGVIPIFVQYLQRHDATALQFESAWALTNIASTNHTKLVADHGAIPHLVTLMGSENADLREQCVWCLGNVAGDSASLRDIVLGYNALPALLANIQQPASLSLLRNCVWTLSNFCRGKPQPNLQQIAPALPALAALITQQNDFEAISDAVWALSYISDGSNERIQAVVEAGGGVVVPALINMLRSDKLLVVVPALRTLGNIVSGNDAQTQLVVSHGVVEAVQPLLSSIKKNIRKEVCWMLSNIAAGNRAQLSKLMSTPGVVAEVVGQLAVTNDWEVRKEAAWVISNIVTSSNDSADTWRHVQELVGMGVLDCLCDLLDVGSVSIITVALESMESILRVAVESGNSVEQYCRIIEEHQGIDKLEGLQEHENEDIYHKAVSIIETYFGGEDEDDNAYNATQQSQQNEGDFIHGFGNCYNFGSNNAENSAPQSTMQQYDFGMPGTTGKASTDFAANSPQYAFGTQASFNNGNSMLPPPPTAFNFENRL